MKPSEKMEYQEYERLSERESLEQGEYSDYKEEDWDWYGEEQESSENGEDF